MPNTESVLIQEYRKKEQEFMERHDSLCENVSPFLCDCYKCPTMDLCRWLCDHQYLVINRAKGADRIVASIPTE